MADPTPQDSPEGVRGTHDRATQNKGVPPRRTPASGTLIPKDELSSDQLIGRADVRSIAPSGREVYDPESRSLDRGIDYESAATRGTGAGEGSSIGIEVPLLGHTEHEKKRKKSLPQSVEKEPKSSFCPGFSPRRAFKESTFQKVRELKKLIERESGGDQVLARAIAGSYAEEYDGRGAVDKAQDIVIAQDSERALKRKRLVNCN